jgi:hypothetical protein
MAESKRTPRREAVILSMLRTGCTHRAAYGRACICKETFYEWMKDPVFSNKVRQAESFAEEAWLKQAVDEGRNAPKLLSMRFRDDWGEQLKIEHSGGVQVSYVNDWRGPAPDASSGPADSSD